MKKFVQVAGLLAVSGVLAGIGVARPTAAGADRSLALSVRRLQEIKTRAIVKKPDGNTMKRSLHFQTYIRNGEAASRGRNHPVFAHGGLA